MDNADPTRLSIETDSARVLAPGDALPERFALSDFPVGDTHETIGEILNPEPPEPDPAEPPGEYHVHCGDESWLKVKGWRVMADYPGMEPYHWFIHRAVHRDGLGEYEQGNGWTISEAVSGRCARPACDCKTRKIAEETWRHYFDEHPENVAKMPALVAKHRGTANESPGYPGKGQP